jgi:hypothetical protein
MASTYPGTLDSLATTKANATTQHTDHPAHHNDLADAVNKIEAELGTNPSGGSATVAAAIVAAAATAGTTFIDVTAFGAAGDGTTNDTAEINDAIDNLPATGGVLFFPPGVYLVTADDPAPFTLPAGTRVLGSGRHATTIKTDDDPGAAARIFNVTGGERAEFYDLTIQGPDTFDVSDDDVSGIAGLSGDNTTIYCNNVRFLRLNVALRQGVGDQLIELDNCELDGDDIGLSGGEAVDFVFGILANTEGAVIARNTHFHNLGSTATPNLSHCLYLSEETSLSLSHCRFENHIDGRYVQVFGSASGGPYPGSPEFWEIDNCYFGVAQVENVAVQTSPDCRAIISDCTFLSARTAIFPGGNALIQGCVFKGDAGGSFWQGRVDQFASMKVTWKDCIFEGDVQLDIDVNHNSIELNVDGCEFRGGAANSHVFISGSLTGVRVRVKNCLFDMAAGAVGVNVSGGGTTTILRVDDCEFRGGARGIYLQATSTVSAFYTRDNYFTGQSTAAITKSGTVTAEDSKSNIGYADV